MRWFKKIILTLTIITTIVTFLTQTTDICGYVKGCLKSGVTTLKINTQEGWIWRTDGSELIKTIALSDAYFYIDAKDSRPYIVATVSIQHLGGGKLKDLCHFRGRNGSLRELCLPGSVYAIERRDGNGLGFCKVQNYDERNGYVVLDLLNQNN